MASANTNSRTSTSVPSEIELINRVHSYFPNNEPTKFFFFYTNTSPFSNFYPCNITENGIEFHCTEQYMMYHKAKLFNDDEIAQKILGTKEPRQCKALGRRVANFDEQIWMENRTKIVSNGNYLKFTQNEDLNVKLLQRKGSLLVEASPSDRIWGVGLREDDPLIKKRSSWKGLNLLGYLLTDICYRIIKLLNTKFEQFTDLIAPAFANNAAEISDFVLRSTFDRLFDQNSNGTIEQKEFDSLLTLLKAFNSNTNDLEKKFLFYENLQQTFPNRHNHISFKEFSEFVKYGYVRELLMG